MTGHRSDEQLNEEGAGMGMGEEPTTFEPEETPGTVDAPGGGRSGGAGAGLGDVVEPRELVPDDDRADELEVPREVLPDDERGVDETAEQESDRLLPDEERPVPGGPADVP